MLTGIALLSLALGIGGTTAMFTVVHQMLLKAFPYPEPDRLFAIWQSSPSRGEDIDPVAPANYNDWQNRTRVFEAIGTSRSPAPYVLTGSGEPVSLLGYEFSANMFHVFGTKPMLGRTFTEEEDRPGFNQVVVLSHKLWKRQFNSDPNIVGRSLTFSGKPYTVIGVMPPEFQHPHHVELWTPLALPPAELDNRNDRYLRLIGRLRDGVTREQAQKEMSAVAAQLEAEHPDTNRAWGVALRSLREEDTADIRPALLTLFTAVVLLLLVSCTNVANLLMTRATERHREFAVRVALGASRGRLIRQVLTESLLLSSLGGVLGLLLAYVGTQWLVRMLPTHIANMDIPTIESLPIDTTVLIFCLAASVFTGLLFGVMPALQSTVSDVLNGLRENARSYSASRRGKSARNVLAVAEIALALVLVTGAGLAIKSFNLLSSSSFGFDPNHVLSFYITMPEYKYKDEDSQRVFMDKLMANLSAVPGVERVGALSFLPLSGYDASLEFTVEGQSYNRGEKPTSSYQAATPGYFEAMRIPVLSGRDLTASDTPDGLKVAIVNRTFVRRFLGDREPLATRINIGDEKKPEWVQVIGVVGDVKHAGLDSKYRPELYVAFQQYPFNIMGFTLRTAGDPNLVISAARQAVWNVDKDQPVARVLSMEAAADESVAIRKITTWIMSLFAGVSLLLACVGIYGVMAFSVVQRTHEFGVRLALGATRSSLLSMVMKQSARLAAIGIVIGIVVAFVLSKAANALVYGVSTRDPLTYVVAPALLGAIALLAGFVPAYRASRLDPYVALRED